MRLAAADERSLPKSGDLAPLQAVLDILAQAGVHHQLGRLGLLVTNSDFHCATDARFSSLPPRVAALRVSSRETVEAFAR